MNSAEQRRIDEIADDNSGWRRWGPYVSERAWGTVREDYSEDGSAWGYLTHDQARSRTFRWGEDGIAAICDRYQLLVFSPAFWNGRDPILKERLFGVSPGEGNHGEDVKESYFHLDNTPTHSYMKYLYKYPQRPFPYHDLVVENQRRGGQGFEYELLDTGVFDDNRYFDIFMEYAKADIDDICIRITAHNRGPDSAPLSLIPQLTFRNTWSWGSERGSEPSVTLRSQTRTSIKLCSDDSTVHTLADIPVKYSLGKLILHAPPGGEPMFTNNETNRKAVFGTDAGQNTPYVKDAFHRKIVHGENCTNPEKIGTKAAICYRYGAVPPGECVELILRLQPEQGKKSSPDILGDAVTVFAQRREEADEFYAALRPGKSTEEECRVQRQALAGLLWNKQSYLFNVSLWLDGDRGDLPPLPSRKEIRNRHWRHLNSMRIMTMPDKWEYPWFAAWDLAFQCVALAQVDAKYAKDQLWVLLFEQFQHPNGQIPAYEWEFSDLNPPVHAWAVWRVFNMDRIRNGKADRLFLERCFHKLLINFAWWVNKVDQSGNNVFEGGFLGLDNITVVDRSEPLANGAVLEQADATGWMGMFCLNLMRIALELAKENSAYESLATKFFQHYTYVASAMKRMGGNSYPLWDEQDGFFYDVLRYPDGEFRKFRVRSLVGLIPLFAVERLEEGWIEPFTEFRANLDWFMKNRPDLVRDVVHTVDREGERTYVLTILNKDQITRILERMLDPDEFLSPYGIRSLSKAHEGAPFEFEGSSISYEPAESLSKLKGGNSNWRGPIWFPTNFLVIESLRKLGKAFGSSFGIVPAGNGGKPVTMHELARDLADRMISIFLPDSRSGSRPVFGGTAKFRDDPHWNELILFHEYFHGDNGAGLGASHQTGWTALVASLVEEWR